MESVEPKDRKLLSSTISFNIVGLVCHQDDWLAAAAQQLRHLSVARVWSGSSVNKEQNQVGGINGNTCLVLDSNLDRITNGRLHSTRVYNTEAHPIPFHDANQAIPGGTCAIFHNRAPLTNEAIKEGALADIRATNERDERETTRQRFQFYLNFVLAHAGVPMVIEVVRY
jgi:hypothetical protein